MDCRDGVPSPEPGGIAASDVPGWRDATPRVIEVYGRLGLVDYRPEAVATLVTSAISPIRITLPAVEALFSDLCVSGECRGSLTTWLRRWRTSGEWTVVTFVPACA